MRKAMYEVNSDCEEYGFKSVCSDLQMVRDESIGWIWVLVRYGIEIDRDRYRHDLAERHNLHLRYSDGCGGWEE